jgi:hypothetical protein
MKSPVRQNGVLNERTLSTALRKAINRSTMPLANLALRAQIETCDLADFLTGKETLQSDAIDRVAKLLKFELQMPKRWPIEKIRIRRIYGTLTPAQNRDLKKKRKLIEKELPELIRRDQQAHDAQKENTICGTVRRAVPTCGILLPDLARRAALDMGDIADFLCGEKALPSDAIDRLVKVLKLKLPASKPKPRRAKAD